jgi:molecular chaperone GrpE (heat shock protein)
MAASSEAIQSSQVSLLPAAQGSGLIDHAVAIWRLENNIQPYICDEEDRVAKKLKSSMHKVKQFLGKNQVEIIDYTGQRYNDGMNIEILSQESDAGTVSPIITETFSPEVRWNGNIIKKAQVIVKIPDEVV